MSNQLDFAKLYQTECLGQILVLSESVNGNPAVTIKYSDRVFGRGERNLIFIGDEAEVSAAEYFKKMTQSTAINQVLLAIKSKVVEVNIT